MNSPKVKILTRSKTRASLPALFGVMLLLPAAMSTAGPNLGCGFASSEPGIWMACTKQICNSTKACTGFAEYELIAYPKLECAISIVSSECTNWNDPQDCQLTIVYQYCGGPEEGRHEEGQELWVNHEKYHLSYLSF